MAYLSESVGRGAPGFLRELNFCCALPADCLSKLILYTVEVSIDALPPLLANFWRCCATAAPPERPGQPPYSVVALSQWVAAQCSQMTSERDKRICKSLLWFIKGLAFAELQEEGSQLPAAIAAMSTVRTRAAATLDRVVPGRTPCTRKRAADVKLGGMDAKGAYVVVGKAKTHVPRLDLSFAEGDDDEHSGTQ